MTYAQTINPIDPFITMKRDGSFKGNNELGLDNPAWTNNQRGWGHPVYNPVGPMPVLNPEHYIHPLTGHYASGCLDFR